MLRTIGAVVAGYVVVFILVFSMFTAAFLALGPSASYQPGTYDVSMLWIVISTVLGFVAAVGGGFVASQIDRTGRGVTGLAGFMFIAGILLAVSALMMPNPAANEPRPDNVSNLEAMAKSQTPHWINFVNPFIGAAGALVGGRLRKSRQE